ncbi:unnamed protein product, partial [Polarella glacialis]
AAAAIARGLREEGGSCQSSLWGLRIFEWISQAHAFTVEPYVGVIVDAMLAEGCLHGTMIAGANAVSHLGAVCPGAAVRLGPHRVQLMKTIQQMAHAAAADGLPDSRQREKELLDWVQVLVDILGPSRPPGSKVKDELDEGEMVALEEEQGGFVEPEAKTGGKSSPTAKVTKAPSTTTM